MSSEVELGRRRPGSRRPGRSVGGARSTNRSVASANRSAWETHYVGAAVAVDVGSIGVAVLVGYLLGLGSRVPQFGDVSPGVGVVAGVLMIASLLATRSWDPRVLGQGAEEFARLIRASVIAALALGVLGLALGALAARPWVFGLMPLAALLAVVGRLALRSRLHRLRNAGLCLLPVLVVGTEAATADIIDRTRRDRRRGWTVVAACTPTGVAEDGDSILGVPVVGDLDSVADVARSDRHRIVAVCPTPGWSSMRLRQLAWRLEDTATELVVDPGLMEIGGPRLHVEPVDGLPLLRLTRPVLSGVPLFAKSIADKLGAALLLILALPLLLLIAVAVKAESHGPVLFRQTRVGRHGEEFTMLKFRSMVADAEAQLAGLVTVNEGAGPLFKMRSDPRVTRVGRILRRYSFDELPQLLNVLAGSMSLVGPRPPLPDEVVSYGHEARRRLMVRPGLTGLWQISGRSDLSWEQSVRLDLRYVENWNLALDALILWKTVGAVLSRRGAY